MASVTHLTTQTNYTFSNSNNVTFGVVGSTVTASASYPTQTAYVFSNANGVTFGTNGSTVTASVNTNYLTTAALSNHSHNFATTTTNGASIVVGTTNSAGATIGVPAFLTTAAATNVTTNNMATSERGNYFYTSNNTFANSTHSHGAVAFTGTNVSASFTSASNGLSINLSAGAGGAGDGYNIIAAGGSTANTTGTIVFSNSNGVSFGLNGATITATVATNYQSQGAYLTTAAQSNHSHGNPTLALTNLAGTTASNSAGLTLSLSATAQSAQPVAVSGSNGSFNFSTLSFGNLNGLSFYTSNGSIVGSYTDGGGGGGAGTTTALNLTNLTGTLSVNTNGVSLSMSAAAPAGGAGLTNYYYPHHVIPLATSAFTSGTSTTVVGGTQHSVYMYVAPLFVESPVIYKEVEMVISGQATVAGTGSATNGYMLGIYTNNASTLSLVTSYQWVHQVTQNSVTARTHRWYWGTNSTTQSSSLSGNVSASFSRVANIILEDGTGSTLSPNTYYIGVIHTARTSSVNLGGNSSAMCWSYSQSTGGSYFGTTVLKPPFEERFFGVVSRTLSATNSGILSMPSTVQSSQITNTGGSSEWRIPFVRFYSNI